MPERSDDPRPPDVARWEPPSYEVISLGCEISAYAPEDDPLF